METAFIVFISILVMTTIFIVQNLSFSRRRSGTHMIIMIGAITFAGIVAYPMFEGMFSSSIAPYGEAVSAPYQGPYTEPVKGQAPLAPSYLYNKTNYTGTQNVFDTEIYSTEDINDLDLLK